MLNKISLALKKSWCEETCYKDFDIENISKGQCTVTSLVIQDYLGGEIRRCKVENIYHYFNYINNDIIDLTSSKFNVPIDYDNYVVKRKNELLKIEDVNKRYTILKEKVDKYLSDLAQIEQNISECSKCGDLVEKFEQLNSISYGKDSNILILGEAPANNGWRKSKIAWYSPTGKLLPSGVVLQKLLNIIDTKLEDTLFLEAIKCYPKNRNSLKKCNLNCKYILESQIKLLNPKIILLLGDSATRAVLNIKYKNFSEVVGNIYEINNIKVIPIYHPSPISPISYSGNIPIFNKIKGSVL